ncbi:hypothetical protein QBC47DRAFT_380883 [Echria macrotheca]|uniref:Uncharacterized protein n=1 Tax=Echria macrotheca TaxID=438768 RepID=A0AAJ0BGX1_9PEZI|nr:hypothetical protein QBC47DRAFT_380883 [Echria macrotheca]
MARRALPSLRDLSTYLISILAVFALQLHLIHARCSTPCRGWLPGIDAFVPVAVGEAQESRKLGLVPLPIPSGTLLWVELSLCVCMMTQLPDLEPRGANHASPVIMRHHCQPAFLSQPGTPQAEVLSPMV